MVHVFNPPSPNLLNIKYDKVQKNTSSMTGYKDVGWGKYCEILSYGLGMFVAHMNSKKLWSPKQDVQKTNQLKILTSRERGSQYPNPTQAILAFAGY